MSVLSFIFGDPAPKRDVAAWDAAFADLRAAKQRGDKFSVQAALVRMRAAGGRLSTASKKAVDNVQAVDQAVANVKSGLTIGGKVVVIAAGLIVLVLIMKK